MNRNPEAVQHLGLLEEHDRIGGLKASISRVIKPGDIVLDAGCGTGVLGLLALKAGAEKIVAVDSHDLSFAKTLAAENNLFEAVQYIQADLDSLEASALPRFNAILGMIYSGHPILDEGQAATKNAIYEKFLLPGGKLIPDHIRWHAYACDWPLYDFSQQTYRFEHAISDRTSHLGLRFQPFWATELSQRQAWKQVTEPYQFGRGLNPLSTHIDEQAGSRILSKRARVADIQYGKTESLLPSSIDFEIIEHGRMTVIIWVRELWFEDILISSRNSISLIGHPVGVTPHDRCRALLDQDWRSTNVFDQCYLVD